MWVVGDIKIFEGQQWMPTRNLQQMFSRLGAFSFLSFFIEVLAYLKNSGKQTSMWQVYWIDLDWNHQDSNKSRTKIDNDHPKRWCLSSNGPRSTHRTWEFLLAWTHIYHVHPSSPNIKSYSGRTLVDLLYLDGPWVVGTVGHVQNSGWVVKL